VLAVAAAISGKTPFVSERVRIPPPPTPLPEGFPVKILAVKCLVFFHVPTLAIGAEKKTSVLRTLDGQNFHSQWAMEWEGAVTAGEG